MWYWCRNNRMDEETEQRVLKHILNKQEFGLIVMMAITICGEK